MNRKKNLRRLSVLVTAQTLYNLQRLADMIGSRNVGRVVDKLTREKMMDVMESDYVLFARARGESLRSIVLRHGLRNVALPAITLQFASVSEIIGGSVLVEQVFSYPGLAAVTAGLGSDLPLLLGITVITAAIVFGGNLIADLLYGAVDPKIRRGAAKS